MPLGASRRHDGQLCHRLDWKPTAATENGLSRVREEKGTHEATKKKKQKEILVLHRWGLRPSLTAPPTRTSGQKKKNQKEKLGYT